MKLIDMYAKSQRNRQTNLCIVYAKKRAQQWLGANAWHECDNSCDHKKACEQCKFYSPDKYIPRGVEEMTCLRP